MERQRWKRGIPRYAFTSVTERLGEGRHAGFRGKTMGFCTSWRSCRGRRGACGFASRGLKPKEGESGVKQIGSCMVEGQSGSWGWLLGCVALLLRAWSPPPHKALSCGPTVPIWCLAGQTPALWWPSGAWPLCIWGQARGLPAEE